MALLQTDRHTGTTPSTDVRHPAVPTPSAGQDPQVVAAPSPEGRAPGRRGKVIAAAVTTVLTLGIGATSVAVTVQDNAVRAEAVRVASAAAAAAEASDLAFLQGADAVAAQGARVAQAEQIAARAAAVAWAVPHVDAARAALVAAPQASAESRTALQAAIDAAAGLTAADPMPFVATTNDAVAALAGPQQAVVESQAAWQAAEDARIAAEAEARAAAARAAAAAQPRTPQAASRSSRSAAPARATAPSTGGAGAAAPAPAAAEPAPAAAGTPEYSAGAIGEAINAYRVANGLPALSVSRSGTLYAHAAAMAAAGSLWHGGSDKIVGFVKPVSASSLVSAWAGSSAHNAWMLREGTSSMQVGAAQLDGRLYAAVNFS